MSEGRLAQAEDHLRAAAGSGELSACRLLALTLIRQNRLAEARTAWPVEREIPPVDLNWLQSRLDQALERRNYRLAGDIGLVLARTRWSSRWWPGDGTDFIPAKLPRDIVTVTKLRHDAQQFASPTPRPSRIRVRRDHPQLRRARGPAGARTAGPRAAGRSIPGPTTSSPPPTTGSFTSARAPASNSPCPDPGSRSQVERQFLDKGTGVVVIDNLLSEEALARLLRFSQELTVWSGIRYAFGRLGAFFNDGFNCPLLLQIAEELQAALPNVISARYPLRQIRGFKNSGHLPPDSNLHADFASVNVNFWLTPEAANADPATGGMVVYDVDVLLGWDFHTYNGRGDIIKSFLAENRARSLYIPYRQNRCVLFNSDLFHGTHEVRFKPGFENHRINVTLLYGYREQDQHHPSLSSRPDCRAAGASSAARGNLRCFQGTAGDRWGCIRSTGKINSSSTSSAASVAATFSTAARATASIRATRCCSSANMAGADCASNPIAGCSRGWR